MCVLYDDNSCIIICLYVGDKVIFESDLSTIENIKRFLSSKFEMKDMGEADVIIRIKVLKNPSGDTLT